MWKANIVNAHGIPYAEPHSVCLRKSYYRLEWASVIAYRDCVIHICYLLWLNVICSAHPLVQIETLIRFFH